MNAMMSRLPEWAKTPLRRFKDVLSRGIYYGTGRFCPVCGNSSRRFRPYGVALRKDAQCSHCGALERHRLLWLYVSTQTNLFDGTPRQMLHVAPEPCLESRFKQRLGDNYLTADLFDPRAMVKMDVTRIEYPDQAFDVIYCSHVLEHVPDDRKAMREFYRVLRNNGWAIVLVPVTVDATFEDPSIVAPSERLKAFGQEDHVRRYGPDYVDRLREAGFKVAISQVSDLAPNEDATRMGLTIECGQIYYCTK